MMYFALVLSLMMGCMSYAVAQGTPSGRGSMSGDPAASSANPRAEPGWTTGSSTSNPSGSGTSTSGGKDDNGDQGRDKMPEGSRRAQQGPKER
jgi:hypothetical protein